MIKIRGQGGLLWKALPSIKFLFYMIGKGWNHFYGWMLDRQERNNSIETILKRGREKHEPGKDKGLYDLSRGIYHAEYLQRHGLKPGHTVLDIGCGFGRTGIPLLRYLEPGKYIGVEISAERSRLAHEWTLHEKLEGKLPRWLVEFDNNLPYLEENSIDFVWAQSVMTHMPLNEINILFKAVHRVLRPGGAILFNFAISEDDTVRRGSIKDYRYPAEKIDELLKKYGLAPTKLDDWQDDLEEQERAKHNIMIKAIK